MNNQNKNSISKILYYIRQTDKNRNFFLFIIIGLSLILGTTARAQTIINLNKGDRVKLSAPTTSERSIIGTVSGVSPEVTTIAVNDSTYYILNSSIEQLAISKGKKHAIGKGALLGAGLGGLIGAVSYKECTDEGFLSCMMRSSNIGEAFLRGTIIGGVFGVVTGFFFKTDRWERLPVKISMGSKPFLYKEALTLNPSLALRISI